VLPPCVDLSAIRVPAIEICAVQRQGSGRVRQLRAGVACTQTSLSHAAILLRINQASAPRLAPSAAHFLRVRLSGARMLRLARAGLDFTP
jgi:hypothetical protein